MKKELKAEILETARRMFNDQGYNGVSMRDIAGELGISVGNLTYHYNRKEALLEAVAEAGHMGYQKAEPMQTLLELDTFFQHRLRFQARNPYLFRNYAQLEQLSSKIYEMHRQVIRDLHEVLSLTFCNWKAQGLMAPDQLEGQSGHLVQALVTICIFGMALAQENRLDCFWSLIYPTLTAAGRAEYLALDRVRCET